MKSKTVDKGLAPGFDNGAEQFKAALLECITEIDRLRKIMRQDDIRIEQSQAQTRILKAQIDEMMKPHERKAA